MLTDEEFARISAALDPAGKELVDITMLSEERWLDFQTAKPQRYVGPAARAEYETAVKLDGRNEPAKRALEALK